MPIFVCLLRGVNLGGHNRLKMEMLRSICEALGHKQVETYIQSGNVVFRSREKDAAAVARPIRNAIEQKAGFAPDVILRTRGELEAVVARNPFAGRPDVAPEKLVVTFFDRLPEPEAITEVNAMQLPPEEFSLVDRDLYVFFPRGMGRSKFPAVSIAKRLRASGTARNWNTILKLVEMAGRAEASDI